MAITASCQPRPQAQASGTAATRARNGTATKTATRIRSKVLLGSGLKSGRGPGPGAGGVRGSPGRGAARSVVAVIGVPRLAGVHRSVGKRLRIHQGPGLMQMRLRNRRLRYRRLRKGNDGIFAGLSARSLLQDTVAQARALQPDTKSAWHRYGPGWQGRNDGQGDVGPDRTLTERWGQANKTGSSGAWTRTRPNRIQSPERCPLPYAGPPCPPGLPDRVAPPRYRVSGGRAPRRPGSSRPRPALVRGPPPPGGPRSRRP